MAERGRRMQRIAMGTFADLQHLDVSVQKLVARAVGFDQICLIGRGPRIDTLKGGSTPLPPATVHGLMDRPRGKTRLDDGTQIVVIPDGFDGIDFEMEQKPQGLLFGLGQTLEEGALVLLVVARTAVEFADVARILLRHGSHQVRTREVAYRAC